MATLLSLLIMVMAFTMGMLLIAIVILVMGFGGMPGALLHHKGKSSYNGFLIFSGYVFTALGQSYVVGAYSVFAVSLLRWFTEGHPDLPTWPLWIAAFYHSGTPASLAMKENPEEPTAQHSTLGFVSLISILVFILIAFSPNTLKPVYGWVPYYQHNNPSSDNSTGLAESRELSAEEKKAAFAFFKGYQALKESFKSDIERASGETNVQITEEVKGKMEGAMEHLKVADKDVLNKMVPGWGDYSYFYVSNFERLLLSPSPFMPKLYDLLASEGSKQKEKWWRDNLETIVKLLVDAPSFFNDPDFKILLSRVEDE